MAKVKILDTTIGNGVSLKMFAKTDDSDTLVTVEDKTLCWVSGAERQEFLDAINEVINKFRI